MGKFAKAETQAASVVKALQRSNIIKSLGTARGYTNALTRVAEHAKSTRIQGGLRGMSLDDAQTYFEQRSEEVGQKQLDMERQALQAMFHHLTDKLPIDDRLPIIKSEQTQHLSCRSYTREQVDYVSNAQHTPNQFSTQLAYKAGLRSHELLTIRKLKERPPSNRPRLDSKFHGRDGQVYTVQGKGGLIREVLIPHDLAEKLEQLRLESPKKVTDRGIHYAQYYNINGGHLWANSFTQVAKRQLGWSTGAHGLRHSYAQERMHELQRLGLKRSLALETVSQELGHFRPQITEIYLR